MYHHPYQNMIFGEEKDVIDEYIDPEGVRKFTSDDLSGPVLGLELFVDGGDSVSRVSLNPKEGNDIVLPDFQQDLMFYNDPAPYVSTQFYTFNKLSYDLMIDCISAGRYATAEEIRVVTPAAILDSWRNAWKDRSEDTGFVTAWKRIQEKLNVRVDAESGKKLLYFKTKSSRFVAYIEQWEEIVLKCHLEGDEDSRHLGVKDTVERVKKLWMVNSKYYGIPESFIRDCVNWCSICCNSSSGLAPLSKRRKIEYMESFDVPVKEVQVKLHELAAKYKTVLCVRQKYIRSTPYPAEVKDYVCDHAGEPIVKSLEDSKKQLHMSKRCGCMFRVRVIVPILKRKEEDKMFVYHDEGVAVFKLYAVHSGHEPGEFDGNARKGVFWKDQDVGYGMREEEGEGSRPVVTVFGRLRKSLLSHLTEIKSEVELLERKVGQMPLDMICSASQTALEALNKFRSLEEHGLKQHFDDDLVGGAEFEVWDRHEKMIYGGIKPAESIEDHGNTSGRPLGNVASWGQMRTDSSSTRDWNL